MSENSETTKNTAKKPTVEKKKKQGNLMYLGPTITGIVRHSTIFKDGIFPKKVNECLEQLPMMKKLFVELDEIPTAIKELKKEQSALGTIYAQTKKKFK